MKPDVMTHESLVLKNLANDEYAQAYLNASLEENDRTQFLLALGRLVEARKIGKTALAKNIQKDRSGLYKIFAGNGNPEFDTIRAILNEAGFDISIIPRVNSVPEPMNPVAEGLGSLDNLSRNLRRVRKSECGPSPGPFRVPRDQQQA